MIEISAVMLWIAISIAGVTMLYLGYSSDKNAKECKFYKNLSERRYKKLTDTMDIKIQYKKRIYLLLLQYNELEEIIANHGNDKLIVEYLDHKLAKELEQDYK